LVESRAASPCDQPVQGRFSPAKQFNLMNHAQRHLYQDFALPEQQLPVMKKAWQPPAVR